MLSTGTSAKMFRHVSAHKARIYHSLMESVAEGLAEVLLGASLRLMSALGLRRQESVQFPPFLHVMPFSETGLPENQQQANRYAWVKGKSGQVRWIPLEDPLQLAALEFAQGVVDSRDAYMGDPRRDLKRNLRRLDYVLEKFGITLRKRGATGHGLRHEVLSDAYEDVVGVPSPLRGGRPISPELDRAARLAVSQLAGHARARAADAYCRKWFVMRSAAPGNPPPRAHDPGSDDSPATALAIGATND